LLHWRGKGELRVRNGSAEREDEIDELTNFKKCVLPQAGVALPRPMWQLLWMFAPVTLISSSCWAGGGGGAVFSRPVAGSGGTLAAGLAGFDT